MSGSRSMSRPALHHIQAHRNEARSPRSTGPHIQRRLLACLIGGALAAGAMVLPMPSAAQSVNARLRGTAPPNTQITALNVATGVTHKTRSNAQGSYLLAGLPPGTYQIGAGMGLQRTVTLSVASTITINFPKAQATPANAPANANATNLEAVTVTASALPEVKTAELGTLVSQHQIATLPQISQNFLEFANIVPGMKFTVKPNGETSLRAGAGYSRSMNVYIDGVSQKSYVMGAAMAGQNASQGNPFPELAIGEYKVITGGFKAQYSQLGSGLITAVTKSGTNEFHGQAFERYTSAKFRKKSPSERHAGEKIPSQQREFGVSFSGPIIKNKMHFFFTYAGKRFNTPITVVPNSNAVPGVAYLPPDVASQLGPAGLPFTEDLYFAKLDFEPDENDRLVLTGNFRFEHSTKDVGGVTAASAGVDNNNINKRYMFKWDHSGNSGWFNELMVANQWTFFRPTPFNFGNGSVYTWNTGTRNVAIVRVGPATPLSYQMKGQKGWTFKDDFTLSPLDWHGTHIIRFGAVYRDLTLIAQDAGDVNPQFSYNVTPDGIDPSFPFKAFFTKPVTGLGLTPRVQTKDDQFGVYIEDDWDVTDKLTLNLGLRWDYERDPSYTNFVTPANVIAAFDKPITAPGVTPVVTFRQATTMGGPGVAYDINDYISNGHNRSNYKGEIQPRLGFSYDLFNDENHVIHGGAGRSYDPNLYNYMQLETTKSAMPEFTVYFRDPATGACLHDQTPCYDWDPALLNGLANLQALVAATNEGGEIDMLNNNLKPPYTDKFSLGMRNRVGAWWTDATVVRTLYHRGFAFTRGNRYPDGSFFGANGAQFSSPTIPGFGGLILGDNGIEVRSTEFLFSAKKPFTKASRWGATVAYTFTNAKGNRDINEHYSFDYPFVWDYPAITSDAVPKHRIVATGSYEGPWGLIFGMKLELATPTPHNFIACFGPGSPYHTQGGNPALTFDNGSHCFATAARPHGSKFIFGHIWGFRDVDFQVTKNFRLPYGATLYARFDVLNVFNFDNYANYTTSVLGGPDGVTAGYNTIGNVNFTPQEIKFELGLKF